MPLPESPGQKQWGLFVVMCSRNTMWGGEYTRYPVVLPFVSVLWVHKMWWLAWVSSSLFRRRKLFLRQHFTFFPIEPENLRIAAEVLMVLRSCWLVSAFKTVPLWAETQLAFGYFAVQLLLVDGFFKRFFLRSAGIWRTAPEPMFLKFSPLRPSPRVSTFWVY